MKNSYSSILDPFIQQCSNTISTFGTIVAISSTLKLGIYLWNLALYRFRAINTPKNKSWWLYQVFRQFHNRRWIWISTHSVYTLLEVLLYSPERTLQSSTYIQKECWDMTCSKLLIQQVPSRLVPSCIQQHSYRTRSADMSPRILQYLSYLFVWHTWSLLENGGHSNV
jgi:hypothetical protein